MNIRLDLELEDVNGIISVLSLLSFTQVQGLIAKIRDQAIVQVQEQQKVEEASAEPAVE